MAVPAHGLAAGLVDRAKVLGMAGEHHLQRLGQVLQQMEAVGDLHRLGRAASRALSVGAGAIAGDHLDTGMRAQPAASVSASRSGSSATGRRRSRSTSTVP